MILFVSGTGTGVGKTWATCALARWIRTLGLDVSVMKPIATGALRLRGSWVSTDALALMKAARIPKERYRQVNPYLFKPPISPHLAARMSGRTINLLWLRRSIYNMERPRRILLVEGVGGVATPLTDKLRWADFLRGFKPSRNLLVCSARVGTLNHTLASLEFLGRRRVICSALVVANYDSLNRRHRENRRELRRLTRLPVIVQPRGSSRLAGDLGSLRSMLP